MSWLTDTLIATGALIALVLVLRGPVARLCGPGMAYALWALPFLRLLLPPLFLPAPAISTGGPATPLVIEINPVPGAAAAAPAWTPLALQAVWLAGALGFLAWRAWQYRAMRRHLLDGAREVGRSGAVRLVESPATTSPVAFGVFDKVVALPEGFIDHPSRTVRDLAIAHELEHHAGRDLAVNIAMQPLLALHWFNPLAWIGWRALRRDQEAACDARVLAGGGAQLRAVYGRVIAGFARAPQLALAAPMACPILAEKSIIHRLRSLTMSEPSPRRRLLGRALIAAGVLALPLTATITYAAADPEPPTAPAAPPAHHEQRIVIIEKQGPEGPGDARLRTRVVTRDGKTIVFKSDKDLTDAEIEARVEQAMRDLPVPPVPPVPPVAGMAPLPPVPPAAPLPPLAGKGETRVIVRRIQGDGEPHVMAFAGGEDGEFACADGTKTAVESADVGKDGKQHKMLMRMCSHGFDMSKAIEGIKQARDRIRKDDNISAKMRDDILKQLDEEIERLSKHG